MRKTQCDSVDSITLSVAPSAAAAASASTPGVSTPVLAGAIAVAAVMGALVALLVVQLPRMRKARMLRHLQAEQPQFGMPTVSVLEMQGTESAVLEGQQQ